MVILPKRFQHLAYKTWLLQSASSAAWPYTDFRYVNTEVRILVSAKQNSFCGPSPKKGLEQKSMLKK